MKALGRCGKVSDRAATHSSVHDITAPGNYWAVDAKVERSNSAHLRDGSIARYWATKQPADADVSRIAQGTSSPRTQIADTSTPRSCLRSPTGRDSTRLRRVYTARDPAKR